MKRIILFLFVVLSTTISFAQSVAKRVKEYNLENKVALQGYDPVAYFESAKAIKGNKEIKSEYNGAIYQFSTESNKALFLKNPHQYEPQFGGFCAYGMSEGYKASIEPEAFTIVDNKLYLNYNLKVKEMWSKEQTTRIKKAILNWENIQKK